MKTEKEIVVDERERSLALREQAVKKREADVAYFQKLCQEEYDSLQAWEEGLMEDWLVLLQTDRELQVELELLAEAKRKMENLTKKGIING